MRLQRWRFGCVLALLAAMVSPFTAIAHDSPVDHVDRALRIYVQDGKLFVRYQVQLTERSALMQLGTMDTNRDGKVSDAERDGYFTKLSAELAAQLKLTLGEKNVALKPSGAVAFLPQFRQSFTFVADVTLPAGKTAGELVDHYSRNFPGAYRWDEPKGAVEKGPRVIVSEAPRVHGTEGHPSVLVVKFDVTN
jgi:hypothetical protein